MLYYENPYLRETDARILERNEGRVLLDRTVLYPGGGGQPADRGFILCGGRKIPARHVGEGWHEIDGECNEERVKVILDWGFRYKMMKMHTAEHAFFRFLQNRGAKLVKIDLGETSTIVFKGDITLDDILDAERKTREMIHVGRKVQAFWISRDEAQKFEELRINWERIKDEKIRVVEIEDHDLSACKGVHVADLSEIGEFIVLKFRDGKRKEVKFAVGKDAEEMHMRNSETLRELCWKHNVDAEKIDSFVSNLVEENGELHRALREISEKLPFEVVKCEGMKMATLKTYAGDRKKIVKRMMEWVNRENGIAVYVELKSGGISIAFPEDAGNTRDAIVNILSERGWKGGGGKNFISGSVPSAEEILEYLKKVICSPTIHLHGDENEPRRTD